MLGYIDKCIGQFDAIAMYVWTKEIQTQVEARTRPGSYLADDFVRPSKRQFIVRVLLSMIKNGWNTQSWLLITILRTVDVILDLLEVDKESALQDKFVLALAHAASVSALEWDIVARFGVKGPPGLEIERLYENALVAAAYLDDLPLIKLLIEKGINPNTETRLFGLPINAATMQGNRASLDLLLENGARVRHCYWRMKSPLHWATKNGDVEILRILMQQKEHAANYMDVYRRDKLPPFSAFPPTAVVPVAEEAVNLGIFLRFPSTSDVTAHQLVYPRSTNLQAASLLPAAVSGDSLVFIAIEYGHVEAVKYLVTKTKTAIDEDGQPTGRPVGDMAMSLAVRGGQEHIVRAFLDPSFKESNFQAALVFEAVLSRHENILRLLLTHKRIDINLCGFDKLTPLALAAKIGDEAMVRILLEREDINTQIVNGFGQTAAQLAEDNGYPRIAQLILERSIYSLVKLKLAD